MVSSSYFRIRFIGTFSTWIAFHGSPSLSGAVIALIIRLCLQVIRFVCETVWNLSQRLRLSAGGGISCRRLGSIRAHCTVLPPRSWCQNRKTRPLSVVGWKLIYTWGVNQSLDRITARSFPSPTGLHHVFHHFFSIFAWKFPRFWTRVAVSRASWSLHRLAHWMRFFPSVVRDDRREVGHSVLGCNGKRTLIDATEKPLALYRNAASTTFAQHASPCR